MKFSGQLVGITLIGGQVNEKNTTRPIPRTCQIAGVGQYASEERIGDLCPEKEIKCHSPISVASPKVFSKEHLTIFQKNAREYKPKGC